MLNLHGQNSTTSPNCCTETNQPSAVNVHTVPARLVVLSHCQQEDNHDRQDINQHNSHLDWSLDSHDTSSGVRDFGIYHSQDSHDTSSGVRDFGIYHSQDLGRLLTPTNKFDNRLWNYHILENQQLGAKSSDIIVSESQLRPSTSDTVGSHEYTSSSMFDGLCDSITVSGSNVNQYHAMDLGSALNELGLLSTVTSSRRHYLFKTCGHTQLNKNKPRLHYKYKSSPNLTSLSHGNDCHLIQLNTNFVTSLSDACSVPSAINVFHQSPRNSECSQLEQNSANILEGNSRCYRSRSQLSRKHKDGHMYRQSRCPYKIPNRFCKSLPESEFGLDNFNSQTSSFEIPASSSPLSEPGVDELGNGQRSLKSKSNTASPLKPSLEVRLTRSLSAEDLTFMCRRLEQELNNKCRESCSREPNLDSMTSQMTNLHMS